MDTPDAVRRVGSFTDRHRPPGGGTIVVDPEWIWYAWYGEPAYPVVWHWCQTGTRDTGCRFDVPHWCAVRAARHIIVTRDPLELEPSLWYPRCCGLHGWIREGRWIRA